MKKPDASVELGELIQLLEIKQAQEKALMIEEFKLTYKSLEPINLIKNAFNELASPSDLKSNIVDSSLGLAAGYLSKKIVFGKTQNSFKQLLGTFLQIGVTSLVSKKVGGILSFLTGVINNYIEKKES